MSEDYTVGRIVFNQNKGGGGCSRPVGVWGKSSPELLSEINTKLDKLLEGAPDRKDERRFYISDTNIPDTDGLKNKYTTTKGHKL